MAKFCVAALIALQALALACQPVTAATLTRFIPFDLKPGPNPISHLAPDGRDGVIIRTSRGNAYAHLYDLYLVTMPSLRGLNDWSIVGVHTFDPEDSTMPLFDDVIRNDPHQGDDMVKSVSFGRGVFGGERGTYLVTALRLVKTSSRDPAPARIDIYRLVRNDGVAGSTSDYFQRVRTFRTRRQYCNSDMALYRELHIPLVQSYQGEKTKSGCVED